MELPDPESAQGGFLGTADAVHQTLHLCSRHAPSLVAVFAADHVYRMDVRQMREAHVLNRADISVATLALPLERASESGVIQVDADGRIRAFQEKPEHPWWMPGRHSHAFASTGNDVFEPVVLATLLDAAACRGEADFGRHMLPRAASTRRLHGYDISGTCVPGRVDRATGSAAEYAGSPMTPATCAATTSTGAGPGQPAAMGPRPSGAKTAPPTALVSNAAGMPSAAACGPAAANASNPIVSAGARRISMPAAPA